MKDAELGDIVYFRDDQGRQRTAIVTRAAKAHVLNLFVFAPNVMATDKHVDDVTRGAGVGQWSFARDLK